MGGVPIAAIPHPLAGIKPEEVKRKANSVVEEVVRILTQPADRLAQEYRSRFLKPREGKVLKQMFA